MIAVIGAGISGLCSAMTLSKLGYKVVVLDKARSVGGRLATRQYDFAYGTRQVDTAASSFELESDCPDFVTLLQETVPSWCCEGRCQPEAGMNSLAQVLKSSFSSRIRYVLDETITSIHYDGNTQLLHVQGRGLYLAHGVIVTPPLPQSQRLLGEFSDLSRSLESFKNYHRSIVLLLFPKIVLDVSSLPSSPIVDRVIRQVHQKLNRPPFPIAVHATYAWSDAHYDESDASIVQRLLDVLKLNRADFLSPQVKRWVSTYDCVSDSEGVCTAERFIGEFSARSTKFRHR